MTLAKSRGSCTAVMLFNSYTPVSRLINTEPSELLCLRLSEPIASESVVCVSGRLVPLYGTKFVIPGHRNNRHLKPCPRHIRQCIGIRIVPDYTENCHGKLWMWYDNASLASYRPCYIATLTTVFSHRFLIGHNRYFPIAFLCY